MIATILLAVGTAIGLALALRVYLIQVFKIAYYETKLKNRGVDISHIENITLREAFK